MEEYKVNELPETDQANIKRGKCPWCLGRLQDGSLLAEHDGDICFDCQSQFIGALTIPD